MPRRPSQVSIATRLGWVSFFNDCSSEIVARALPLLLTGALGASPFFLGVIEGLAEAGSIFLKGAAGWLSDRLESRKPLVLFGYSASVASRLLLWLAAAPLAVGLARLLDRAGKGLRSAPRDALVADAAAVGMTGRAFAITRFLDTLGAVTGLLLALALGVGSGPLDLTTWRELLVISIPFGVVCVAVLAWWVPRVPRKTAAKRYVAWHLPQEIRGYLLAVFVFSLGNSSDAFWVLRARQLGLGFRETLIVLVAFNVFAAALALPVGRLSDRFGRKRFLVVGWLVYGLCYAGGAFAETVPAFIGAFLLYGAFYGFTEGVEKALLADLLPADRRGLGFGALQLVLGLAALPASALTGWLMADVSSFAAFLTCAAFAFVGLALLVVLVRKPVLAST
jgi:MFS family permease